MTKTPAMRIWEIDNDLTLEEVFSELAHHSLLHVATKYRIPYPTARDWSRRLGVQVERKVTFAGAGK